ncbi:hypothetical protein Ocin01_02026 [Orchesella cincta]|uniref:Uncharacterized protein n=1 Tax=Orchesella cincta TaxID=48709 RepID=A0A1D2NHE3_ORCCI|nr:hypothetical protein Ocin01_02026 [Orchesella cincta]
MTILCETLEGIERVGNISQAAVIEQYIKRERPFIVTDAMDDWHVMKTDQFWFDNITEIYIHHNNYRVCNIQTNLRVSYGDLGKVMRKENCQKESAKVTRQFYKRPYFISNSLDFTGSNWVMMSSDFRGRVYKKIESSDSLSMLYQIRGFNHIRLSPRETCRGYCPELIETLAEGEILVTTNLLWILEYIPGEDGDNLAILSEVSWPSLE